MIRRYRILMIDLYYVILILATETGLPQQLFLIFFQLSSQKMTAALRRTFVRPSSSLLPATPSPQRWSSSISTIIKQHCSSHFDHLHVYRPASSPLFLSLVFALCPSSAASPSVCQHRNTISDFTAFHLFDYFLPRIIPVPSTILDRSYPFLPPPLLPVLTSPHSPTRGWLFRSPIT